MMIDDLLCSKVDVAEAKVMVARASISMRLFMLKFEQDFTISGCEMGVLFKCLHPANL